MLHCGRVLKSLQLNQRWPWGACGYFGMRHICDRPVWLWFRSCEDATWRSRVFKLPVSSFFALTLLFALEVLLLTLEGFGKLCFLVAFWWSLDGVVVVVFVLFHLGVGVWWCCGVFGGSVVLCSWSGVVVARIAPPPATQARQQAKASARPNKGHLQGQKMQIFPSKVKKLSRFNKNPARGTKLWAPYYPYLK